MTIAVIILGSLLYIAIAIAVLKLLFAVEFLVNIIIRPRKSELWIFSAMVIKAAFWPVTTLSYLAIWLVEDKIVFRDSSRSHSFE